MMNRTSMFASLALVVAAACGSAQDSTSQPSSVAESRQETRSSGATAAQKTEQHSEMCLKERAKDPAMAEAKDLLGEKKYGEAAAKFEAIAAAHPENAKAALMHGYALHAAGRLDEALAAHERAAKFTEVSATALYNIACVHALQGNADKAFAALDQSIKAGFSMADHMKKDEDLASIRNDPRFASAMKAAAANPQKEKKESKEMCQHPSHAKK